MPFRGEDSGPDSEQQGGLMNHFLAIILSYLPALQRQKHIFQRLQEFSPGMFALSWWCKGGSGTESRDSTQ